MKGAIAAGHPLTAEAGARVLREGGNAVDACIAAAFTSWVCESPLTGPGGGGFMLVHDARDGKTRLLDFFVAVPAAASATAELLELAVDFDGDTQQLFRTGAAAVAVPGTVLGLEEAHRRWGTVPWAELAAPAARAGAGGRGADGASRGICTGSWTGCCAIRRRATRCTAGGRSRRASGSRCRSWGRRSSGSARRARRRCTRASWRARRSSTCSAAAGR